MPTCRWSIGLECSISLQPMKARGMSRSDVEAHRAHSCARKSEAFCLQCNFTCLPQYKYGDVYSGLLKLVSFFPECHVMLFHKKSLTKDRMQTLQLYIKSSNQTCDLTPRQQHLKVGLPMWP